MRDKNDSLENTQARKLIWLKDFIFKPTNKIITKCHLAGSGIEICY